MCQKLVERNFGGITNLMEHGFAGKKAANGDAINAASELVAQPALYTVRMASFMQMCVGFDEFRCNPGAATAWSRPGATFHNTPKSLVASDEEGLLVEDPA